MHKAERLLQRFETALPTQDGRKHSLSLEGGELQLNLWIETGHLGHTGQVTGLYVKFDPEDYQREIDELVTDILSTIQQKLS